MDTSWLSGLYQELIIFVQWIWSYLQEPLLWLVDGIFYVLKGTVWLFGTGVLGSAAGIIHGIDFSSVIFQFAAGWGGLPPQMIYVVNAVGIPQFITIVASGYAVRLALNLIPSWITRA